MDTSRGWPSVWSENIDQNLNQIAGESVEYFLNTETNEIVKWEQPAKEWVMKKIEDWKKYYKKNGKFYLDNVEGSSEIFDLSENISNYFGKQEDAKNNLISKENAAETVVNKEENVDLIEQMKLLLDTKDSAAIEWMKSEQESLRSELSELKGMLSEFLKAKKSWVDTSEMRKNIVEKKKVVNTRAVKYFYAPKYQTEEIKKLWYSPIGLINYNDNKDELSVLTLRKPSAVLKRFRIAKMIRNLQNIWSDVKKWVNYVMSMARVRRGGSMAVFVKKRWRNVLLKVGIKRDMDTFKVKFNSNVKKFLDRISKSGLTDREKKTVGQIQTRLDYYRDSFIAEKIEKMRA